MPSGFSVETILQLQTREHAEMREREREAANERKAD
jgi:predicted outer membrane lipoprotein